MMYHFVCDKLRIREGTELGNKTQYQSGGR